MSVLLCFVLEENALTSFIPSPEAEPTTFLEFPARSEPGGESAMSLHPASDSAGRTQPSALSLLGMENASDFTKNAGTRVQFRIIPVLIPAKTRLPNRTRARG